MSFSFSDLVGPLLGEIPEVGPFLADVYDAEETDETNERLQDTLNAIEASIANLQNELSGIYEEIEMVNLYGSTHQAQANIETYYNTFVKGWLDGTIAPSFLKGKYLDTSKVGFDAKNCIDAINFIHQAMIGTLDGNAPNANNANASNTTWINLVIQKMITSPTMAQSASYLEMTYQVFLKLIRLQLRAVVCLRAINSDDLLAYSYLVNKNIIAQGNHCQGLVNQYRETENLAFEWFGQGNASPDPSNFINLETTNIKVNVSPQTLAPQQVAGGIEFNAVTPGLQMAGGVLNAKGQLQNQSWNTVQGTSTVNGCQPDGASTSLFVFNDILELSGNRVITGITLDFTNYYGREWKWTGWQHYNRDGMSLSVNYVQLGAMGQPVASGTLAQTESPVKLAGPYVSANQFSTSPCNYPITGIKFAQISNQGGLQLQTSLHGNSFAPVLINQAPFVSLKNVATKLHLAYDMCSFQLSGKTNDTCQVGQGFSLSGLSATPAYGDQVQVIYADEFNLGVIKLNAVKGNISVSNVSDDNDEHALWQLVDPFDLTDSTDLIYNWSNVALKNVATGEYLLSDVNGTISTGKPSTKSAAIVDKSYVWNFSLLASALLGGYEILAPDNSPDQYALAMGWGGDTPTMNSQPQSVGVNTQKILITAVGDGNYLIGSNVNPGYYLQYEVLPSGVPDFTIAPLADGDERFFFKITRTVGGVNIQSVYDPIYYVALPTNNEGTIEPVTPVPISNGYAYNTINALEGPASYGIYLAANTELALALGTVSTDLNCQDKADVSCQQIQLFPVGGGRYVVQSSQENTGAGAKYACLQFNTTNHTFQMAQLVEGDPSFQFMITQQPGAYYQLESVVSPGSYLGLPSAPGVVATVGATDPSSQLTLSPSL